MRLKATTVSLIAVAMFALAGSAGAVPSPARLPAGYKFDSVKYRIRHHGPIRFVYRYWNQRRSTMITYIAVSPYRGGGCSGRTAQKLIHVPSWVRVHAVTGDVVPSPFHGRTIFYRDDSDAASVHLKAWACTGGRYRLYVNVFTKSDRSIGALDLAQMIWSTSDS
jgi:hypothetical protein